MSYIERGLYRDLLDECWAEGGIPDDIEELADICGCPVDIMASAWQVLSRCFEPSGNGFLVNRRIDSERTAKDAERASRQIAGAIGGKKKSENSQQNQDASSTCQASASTCQASASTCHIELEEKRTRREEKSKEKHLSADADLSAVFDHWRSRMNHKGAKLDDKRKKLIQKALKLGYTATDLIAAIDGCAKSAWHMGQNDRNTVYDGLDLILRDASKIDNFIKINSQPVQAGGSNAPHKPALTGTAARNAEVSSAVRKLRDGTAGKGEESGGRDFQQAAAGHAGEIFEHVPD